jgi:hypothetical protein
VYCAVACPKKRQRPKNKRIRQDLEELFCDKTTRKHSENGMGDKTLDVWVRDREGWVRGWLPFGRFPVACQKSNPSSYSRAILKRGTRKTSLRHKYVSQSKGRGGGPFARFRKTRTQQGGASQPSLQCLNSCKERRV